MRCTRARFHTDAPTFSSARSAGSRVHVLERHRGVADVRGLGRVEEPRLEHLRGERERRLVRGQVQGRARDEVPEALDRARGLAVRAQPLAERHARRCADRRGATDFSRSAVGPSRRRSPSESGAKRSRLLARCSGAGSGARRSHDVRAAGREHRDREPRLQHGALARADPLEELRCTTCSSAGTRAGRCRPSRPCSSVDNVAPPSRGRASNSETSQPASPQASAAADARRARRRRPRRAARARSQPRSRRAGARDRAGAAWPARRARRSPRARSRRAPRARRR